MSAPQKTVAQAVHGPRRRQPRGRQCSRRAFLAQVLAGGSAGLVGAAIGLPDAAGEPLPVPIGALAELPPGSVRELPQHGLILRRGARGLHALVARCTHLGCRVRLSGEEIVCPCHEGRFDLDGAVLGGPPRAPLARARVTVSAAGQLYYHPGVREERDRWPAHEEPASTCAASPGG